MSKINAGSQVERTQSQVSTELDGEMVVLQLESGHYFSLNEVGALVWSSLTEPRSVAQLCQLIGDEYEVDEVTCGRDLVALLESLRAEGLVRIRP